MLYLTYDLIRFSLPCDSEKMIDTSAVWIALEGRFSIKKTLIKQDTLFKLCCQKMSKWDFIKFGTNPNSKIAHKMSLRHTFEMEKIHSNILHNKGRRIALSNSYVKPECFLFHISV